MAKKDNPEKQQKLTGVEIAPDKQDESFDPSTDLVNKETLPDPDVDLLQPIEENPISEEEKAAYEKAAKENPAGKLQKLYLEKYGKDLEKFTEGDRQKLREQSIKDLRFNHRLLKTREGTEDAETQKLNLKEETARRIQAYTSARDNDWYTLDYTSVDKSHETKIGLGDILLDPDIKAVLIEQNGRIYKATRGTVGPGQRHAGRLGFIKEDGSYAATFTTDRFRILSSEEMSTTKFIDELISENKTRQDNYEHFDEMEKAASQKIDVKDIFTENGQIDKKYQIKLNEKKNVAEQISGLSSQQISMVNIIEREFRKAGLGNINLIGAAVINAISESRLNPRIAGDAGKSIGLFQLHSNGAGRGMSVGERQDPALNTRRIIQEVKSPYGRELLAAATQDASLPELTAIFCRDIERPRDTAGDMKKRAVMATNYFRNATPSSATV